MKNAREAIITLTLILGILSLGTLMVTNIEPTPEHTNPVFENDTEYKPNFKPLPPPLRSPF